MKENTFEAENHFIDDGEEEAAAAAQDSFDLLPDDVVLTIFQKLRDARALCLSMCVCRRFRRIVPGVSEISYGVAQKKPPPPRGLKNTAHKTIKSLLMKPFHLLSQAMNKLSRSKNEDAGLDFYSFHAPSRALKPFDGVRSLSLRLPCQGSKHSRDSSSSSSNLLKWRADFGREMRSCVILGAKSWVAGGEIENPRKESSQEPTAEEVMTEGELKLRIVWTISCLIAASARHYLVRETLRNHKSIENVVVSDEIEQGVVRMDGGGIREMREQLTTGDDGDDSAAGERRSKVPALKMKMWHLDRVEVSGRVLRGATLVVIRPAGDVGEDSKEVKWEEVVVGAFGGEDSALDGAVRKLMAAKRCYTLEMNSF